MREIKKLILLFVLIFSLNSCGDNYYDSGLVSLPTANTEIVVNPTNYSDKFGIDIKFKNIYDKPITQLYITYYILDRYNYPLIDWRTNRKAQQYLYIGILEPGQEYTFKIPYYFYNIYSYKGRVIQILAKFQE